MRQIPETGYLRLWQILGCSKTGNPPLIPVSKTTWWDGVKRGRFPAPTRALGGRIAAWRVEDIRALIEAPKIAP
jgi:prophage regulatory protein